MEGTWPTFRQVSPTFFEEGPHLGQAALQPGQLLDHPLSFPGRPRRVLQEVVFQGPGVGREVALGPVELDVPQGRDAAFEVLAEVALDGAAAEVGQAGDLGVRQAAALQPQDLHLPAGRGWGWWNRSRRRAATSASVKANSRMANPGFRTGETPGTGVAVSPPSGKCQLWPTGVYHPRVNSRPA